MFIRKVCGIGVDDAFFIRHRDWWMDGASSTSHVVTDDPTRAKRRYNYSLAQRDH
jgi:hypothetical protein